MYRRLLFYYNYIVLYCTSFEFNIAWNYEVISEKERFQSQNSTNWNKTRPRGIWGDFWQLQHELVVERTAVRSQ